MTLVYVHVPKCAGTTFTRILDGYFDQGAIYPYKLWAKLPPVEERRAAFAGKALIRGHIYPVVADYVAEPVLITMLRHPVERCISEYYFLRRRGQQKRNLESQFARAAALDIDAFFDDEARYPNNGIARMLGQPGEPDDLPLETKIDHAKRFIDRCAFVGLVERFGESLDLMTWRLGWAYPTLPKRQNVGHDRPRVEEIDPAVVRRIRRWNWADIEIYEYARQRFERDLGVMDSCRA